MMDKLSGREVRTNSPMCDALYLRMEKEITRLGGIARTFHGHEKKFVNDLIRILEEEKTEYRSRTPA